MAVIKVKLYTHGKSPYTWKISTVVENYLRLWKISTVLQNYPHSWKIIDIRGNSPKSSILIVVEKFYTHKKLVVLWVGCIIIL